MRGRLSKYYLLLFLLVVFSQSNGQQFPLTSQYVVNPYSLNPAFAGFLSTGEFFLDYRRDWTRIDGSPLTVRASGNARIYADKMWLGGELMMDKADIFQRFKGMLSYTYRLQMTENQHLSFGLWGSITQNLLRVDQVNADMDDPLLKDLTRIFETTYNAGFSLIYTRNRLNLGFAMPTLFRTEDAYVASNDNGFAFEQEYIFHASDIIRLDEEWQLQPFFVWRRTSHHPSSIDLSATIIYLDRVWLSGLYRNSGLFALGFGTELSGRFVINYIYEIGLNGINSQSGGSHEITVGYRIIGDRGFSFEKGKKKKIKTNKAPVRKYPSSAPNLDQYKFRK
ncbi:MAG: PorP/SprF family type IX secretion system membrane protein [Bacteroidales bacterium]|nr:PorP/SprF family type IX secretion system membrane protein [Bacteroidales bacterium]